MVALKLAAGILGAGKMFAIYPEGTRSRDGKLHTGHTGHTGAAYLSIATGARIVPTGIVGTERIQPPGTRVPRPFRPVVVPTQQPIVIEGSPVRQGPRGRLGDDPPPPPRAPRSVHRRRPRVTTAGSSLI